MLAFHLLRNLRKTLKTQNVTAKNRFRLISLWKETPKTAYFALARNPEFRLFRFGKKPRISPISLLPYKS